MGEVQTPIKKDTLIYAVPIISGILFLYESLYIRIISAVLYNNYVFLIISLSVVGYGVGSHIYHNLSEIDTIKNFCEYEKLSNSTLFFILGSDNINEIHLWKDPEQIFNLANVVVLRRPGSEESPVIDEYKNRIILIDLPLMPVSSTDLRNKIRNGQDYHNLIPCDVAKIIEKYNLYR